MLRSEIKGEFKHVWSDENFKIRNTNTNAIYDDVITLISNGYSYEETDIKIEGCALSPEESLNMIFGGDSND